MIVLDAASKARARTNILSLYICIFTSTRLCLHHLGRKKATRLRSIYPPPPNNKICDVAVLSRSLPVIGDVNLALMGRARARNVESISSSINEQLL